MVRFKMLAEDIDVQYPEYRVWTVDGYPDYDGYYYTGPKAGSHPLTDIFATEIPTDGYYDFGVPNPLWWKTTYQTIPFNMANAQLAVSPVDGYIYLFGGKNTDGYILFCSPADPTVWYNTGYTLPTSLYGAQTFVENNNIYLIGGFSNGVVTSSIYYASFNNLSSWTTVSSALPAPLAYSQLAVFNNSIYLFGGYNTNSPTNIVYMTNYNTPTTGWNQVGTLPDNLYGSHLSIIGTNIYLFGGQLSISIKTNNIYRTSISTPTSWSQVGSLPSAVSFGQLIVISDDGYANSYGYPSLTSPEYDSRVYLFSCSKIFRSFSSDPTNWVSGANNITWNFPGNASNGNIAMINDRAFIFDGYNNVYICDMRYTFNLNKDPQNRDLYTAYGNFTRGFYPTCAYPALFEALGYPYWKTNYFHY